MKRMIKCADESQSLNAQLMQLLKKYNIDTTKAEYELYAEAYERYESGKRYRRKFRCPGDYLAYLSMLLHKQPNAESIIYEFGSLDEFEEEIIAENPTLRDIEDLASSSWWGDGDDYIIYLKNLTTGEYLYGPEEIEEDDEFEEDWED